MITRALSPLRALSVAALMAGLVPAAAMAASEGGHVTIPRQKWTFGGLFGQFDEAQLQRGFQVYQEVCASCHGLDRVAFRNLV